MSLALELKDLRKSFGRTDIIRGVGLQVESGQRLAIIGPNGGGKATLVNLISGGLRPGRGSDGRRPPRRHRRTMRPRNSCRRWTP